jgi:hypothetical protein
MHCRLTKGKSCHTILYMSRAASHDRTPGGVEKFAQFKSSLSGGDDALRYLVDWLNSNENGKARERVRQLLDLGKAWLHFSRPSDRKKIANRINEFLQAFPAVRTVLLQDGKITTVWRRPSISLASLLNPTPELMQVLQKGKEHMMVHIVIDALEEGSLQKLGYCACGKYFFARFSLARFCSAKCRVGFWESSPERKAQKREQARKYYRLHKNPNIK